MKKLLNEDKMCLAITVGYYAVGSIFAIINFEDRYNVLLVIKGITREVDGERHTLKVSK